MMKHKKTICIALAFAVLLTMSLCGCTLPGGKSKLAITDVVGYTVPAGWIDEEMDAPSERAIHKDGEESYIGLFIVKRGNRQQWKDEKTMRKKYKVGKLIKKEIVEEVKYEFTEIDGLPAGIVEESYHTKDDNTTRWAKHCEVMINDKECLMVMAKTMNQNDYEIIDNFIRNLNFKVRPEE